MDNRSASQRLSGRTGTSRSSTGTAGGAVVKAGQDYDRIFSQLCHVVSLSATSKRPQVVEGFIETALADMAVGVSAGDLPDLLVNLFGVSIPVAEVDKAWRHMVVTQYLENHQGTLTLSPIRAAGVRARIAAADQLEARVRQDWLRQTQLVFRFDVAKGDALWTALRTYMAVVFRQHGVRAAALLTPSPDNDASEVTSLSDELDAAAVECGLECSPELHAAVGAFFTTPDVDRAKYLAQLLDATFTFFTLSTPTVAADYLRSHLGPLKVFLDTNTLYDLLGLHEDPGPTDELVSFIRDNNLPVDLLVHERTVKEFERTVDHAKDLLTARQWSPSLSSAALRDPDLSGFLRRFHELNADSPIDPRAFMLRFDHVTALLRDHAVRVYRDGGHYGTDEKALLVADYMAFLAESRPGKAEKRYGVLDHDIAVLLDTHGERRAGKTALDCGSLFVTNDTSLFRFEHRRSERHDIPAVALVAQLLQVLRPFGVPSVALNERFVKMFAIPQFRIAHSDYAQTRAQIRGYLASFKDVPAETAAGIMGDELLLQQLTDLNEDDEHFRELVDHAIMMENVRLIEERQDFELRAMTAEDATKHLQLELARREQAHEEEAERAADAAVRAEARARLAEEQAAQMAESEVQAVARLGTVEGRLRDLEASAEAGSKARARRRRHIIGFAVIVAALTACAIAIWGPDHLDALRGMLQVRGRKGLQAFACIAAGSLAGASLYRPHAKELLYGVLFSAVGSIVAILAG